jgi:hypothetical protein
MRKHQSRLPIILVLITLLSAADWAVCGASTRMRSWLPSGTRGSFGGATTFSGEPDTPGVRTGGTGTGATGGYSRRVIISDARTYVGAGIWIRMFEVRLLGR